MLTKTNRTAAGALAFVAASLAALAAASANETDQYTLPPADRFADLGDFLDHVHCRVLEEAVEETNEKIASVLKIKDPFVRERELKRLHDPKRIADVVRWKFKPGFFEQADIDDTLRSGTFRDNFPGLITGHTTPGWIYAYTHLPIDPRRIVLMYHSATIRAYGVYFGTDKLAHFHDLGHYYYMHYMRKRESGRTHEEAIDSVLATFTRGPISEGAIIGLFATGVHSNADLAANYAGMKFYMNLTEPVDFMGKTLPPMLVRKGSFWRLNHHVRPESGFFGAFVSDHFNEALNPCDYEWGVRKMVRWRMKQMADDILAFYADENGSPRPPEHFRRLARELSTFDGEPYGHSGNFDTLLTIGDVCWPASEEFATLRTAATDDAGD